MIRHITTSLSVIALSLSLAACSDTSSVAPDSPDYAALGQSQHTNSADLAKPDFYPHPVSTKVRETVSIGVNDAQGGSADPVTWTTRDELGNVVVREDDVDGNGTIDRRREYTYDSVTGFLMSEVLDDNADGEDDARWFFEYDEAGQIISKATDQDADGRIDSIWTLR